MAFSIVQLLYWLCLSTWLGSLMFVALAAPVVFRTIAEADPVLPDVLSVNLDRQHATLLAGSVMMNLLRRLTVIQITCGTVVLLTMVLQLFVARYPDHGVSAIVRAVLLAATAAVVVVDRQLVWPRLSKNRSEYLDHADEPDIANPAKDRFDADQRLSLTLLAVSISLLTGIVLFSASIYPPMTTINLGPTR